MIRVERTRTIEIDGPVERVFPLFTPKGEEAWARGWKPDYLYPEDGATREGMVFRTGEAEETTLWSCVAYSPETHTLRYVRVTPASRLTLVDVNCREAARVRTEASVTYRVTALTPHGSDFVARFTEQAFNAMIDGWRNAIHDALARTTA